MKMMHGAARICSDRCARCACGWVRGVDLRGVWWGIPCGDVVCCVCRMLDGDLRGEWWDIPGGDCLLCSRGLSAAIPTVCVERRSVSDRNPLLV